MRWARWAALLGLLACGCAAMPREAAPPAVPPRGEATPAISGPTAVGHVWGYQPHRRIRGRGRAVRERYAFTVYRDEAYIGRVVVSQVFPDYAAARYGPSMRADVEVGDEAATRLLIDF